MSGTERPANHSPAARSVRRYGEAPQTPSQAWLGNGSQPAEPRGQSGDMYVRRTGLSNAAKTGQSIQPGAAASPDLVAYFYNLTISAHDAIFGSATGDVALVTLPDHSVRHVPLGLARSVTLDDVPEGSYRVSVAAGHAIVLGAEVSLSRTATVDLTVISVADAAVTGGPVVIGVLCFLLLSPKRRAWLRNALRYRRKEVSSV